MPDRKKRVRRSTPPAARKRRKRTAADLSVLIGFAPNPSRQFDSALATALAGSPTNIDATTHFSVFCMPNLLPAGNQIALGVLAQCEKDYTQLTKWFSIDPCSIDPSLHFNVTLAGISKFLDGTGGATHKGCDSAEICCDVKLNPEVDATVSSALLMAEAVEVFSAYQKLGWDCSASNGEGLSRVLAAGQYPGVLTGGYLSAYAWLDGNRLNWVDNTDNTDVDGESTGCAVLFLNWMNTQLGIGWDVICQAGGSELAKMYKAVTGKNDGWQQFSALLNHAFPPTNPCGLKTDNPFPLT